MTTRQQMYDLKYQIRLERLSEKLGNRAEAISSAGLKGSTMRQILHGCIIRVSISHCMFRKHSHFPVQVYQAVQAVVDSSHGFSVRQPPIEQIRSRNKRNRTASSGQCTSKEGENEKGNKRLKSSQTPWDDCGSPVTRCAYMFHNLSGT